MAPARAPNLAVPVKIAALAAIAQNVVVLAACVSKFIQNFKMHLNKKSPANDGASFFVRLSCKYSYKTTSLCASFSLVVFLVFVIILTPVRQPPIALLS